MSLKLLSNSKCFDGEQRVYSHNSEVLGCEMKFGVYIPPTAIRSNTECPLLYFLSGYSCTHEAFIQKSGFQRFAAKHGIIVVNPDTTPRGLHYPDKNVKYDFFFDAGMYVDATEAPWYKNYKMYTYVTRELVDLVNANFPVQPKKSSIFGHSMGGHGALICALKNPGLYLSVSTFAALANPTKGELGRQTLGGYFGPNEELWKAWDASELAPTYTGPLLEILLDQGSEDTLLAAKYLSPENFVTAAADNAHLKVIYKLRDGYDHGSYYSSTFLEEHFEHHAKFLKA